jgi:hypothetical protein
MLTRARWLATDASDSGVTAFTRPRSDPAFRTDPQPLSCSLGPCITKNALVTYKPLPSSRSHRQSFEERRLPCEDHLHVRLIDCASASELNILVAVSLSPRRGVKLFQVNRRANFFRPGTDARLALKKSFVPYCSRHKIDHTGRKHFDQLHGCPTISCSLDGQGSVFY